MQKGENEDLNLHVSICEQRYITLNHRLDRVEERLTVIETDFKTGMKSILATLISTGIAVVGSFFAILSQL